MVTERSPTSADELCEVVEAGSGGLLVRGGGTKPALSGIGPGVSTVIHTTGLSGIVEYQPSEYTITSLAGTPMGELSGQLEQAGQFLPFDPLLLESGATVGGTIAAGTSGPGRLRFGGVRDFLLGVSFVDGQGRFAKAGGRVVKNAAGFDIPKLMVGSLGRLGILVEATFKVFPRPQKYASLRVEIDDLTGALEVVEDLLDAPFDLAALDLDFPGSLLVRIGGFEQTLEARLQRLADRIGGLCSSAAVAVASSNDEVGLWRARTELAWSSDAPMLIKLPATSTELRGLAESFAETSARLIWSAGCQVFLSWSEDREGLSERLSQLRMRALVLRGEAGSRFLGAPATGAVMQEKVEHALDPMGRLSFETS